MLMYNMEAFPSVWFAHSVYYVFVSSQLCFWEYQKITVLTVNLSGSSSLGYNRQLLTSIQHIITVLFLCMCVCLRVVSVMFILLFKRAQSAKMSTMKLLEAEILDSRGKKAEEMVADLKPLKDKILETIDSCHQAPYAVAYMSNFWFSQKVRTKRVENGKFAFIWVQHLFLTSNTQFVALFGEV